MLSQQILTKQVVQYLRQNHSIRLNLPNLFRSIDSKVTLKYLKSFPLSKSQNRYSILIQKADQLLKKNLLNLQKIKIYSQDFFNTITQDIVILQQNHKLLKRIPQTKDQILWKTQQISQFQLNIKTQCLRINDKQDILSFISDNLKNYLNKVFVIAEEYSNVNKLEILTSINIDELYQENLLEDQDQYYKWYKPLLEILNKLKSNMIKVYQQILDCDPYDIPIKCVNFLANCKSLIIELEPFILAKQCTFNKLIFYVVRSQKQNLELIAGNYQHVLEFCKEIVSDLFKSYFLGFMFRNDYLEIKEILESIRQELIEVVNNQEMSEINLNEMLKLELNRIVECREKIKDVKRIIGIGKDGFMKDYVQKKQCKKLTMIKQCKQQCQSLKKMIQKFISYYHKKKQIQQLQNKQIQQSSKIIKQIRILQKLNTITKLSTSPIFPKQQPQKQKTTPQKRFQLTFLKIQQLILQINSIKNQLQLQIQIYHSKKKCQYVEILIQYLKNRIQKLGRINLNYVELETKLLNTYVSIKEQSEKLKQESEEIREKTLYKIQEFFEEELKVSIGSEICNEDHLCESIKNKIMQVGKADYLTNQWKKANLTTINTNIDSSKKQSELDSINFYRNNLQWLLVVFEGSMDEKIFQMIMDKLDFEAQDYLQRQKKVKQLIAELTKYIKDLKNLLKSHALSSIHPTVYKIIKDRIYLYQIILDLYQQFLLVFVQTKKSNLQFNIENKGLLLGDQKTFKYVLMIYQFKNKLRTELQQLKQLMLTSRTRNYLTDQLFQPFMIRYSQFITYKQQQLLNFVLRLQHALNIEQNQAKIIKKFQQFVTKPISSNQQRIDLYEEYFVTLNKIVKQFKEINKQNQLVVSLENQPVVIHNLNNFKQMISNYQDYYIFMEILNQEYENILPYFQNEEKQFKYDAYVRQDAIQRQIQRVNDQVSLKIKNNNVNRVKDVIMDRINQYHTMLQKKLGNSKQSSYKPPRKYDQYQPQQDY